MPPKENRDDRNAKRPANTGNVCAGRCYVRGMIALTLSCRKKGDYLGSRASHLPERLTPHGVAEDLGGGGGELVGLDREIRPFREMFSRSV